MKHVTGIEQASARAEARGGAWRAYRRNRPAMVALSIIAAIALVALIAPPLYPHAPFDIVAAPFIPPFSEGFILGTDYLGRDMAAGLIHGARISLLVGLAAAVLTTVIGVAVGGLAGFHRGAVGEALMRITEFFQVLPTLLFSMVIVALFGAGLPVIVLAIGIVSWPPVARVTRAEFLRLGALDYVTASRAAGAGNGALILRVILPNAAPPIIVQAALMVGAAILFEAGLSFLGLTDPNVVSWGQMIGNARQYILDAAYLVTIPGLAIFITVLATALVGDGINDALNPGLRRR